MGVFLLFFWINVDGWISSDFIFGAGVLYGFSVSGVLIAKFINLGIMKSGTYNIDLEFNQILDLVRQLSKKEKLRLSRELEKEIIDGKLTCLLKAFKTDDLDQETIYREVEIVRSELYTKGKTT